jgi:hypothetical protein
VHQRPSPRALLTLLLTLFAPLARSLQTRSCAVATRHALATWRAIAAAAADGRRMLATAEAYADVAALRRGLAAWRQRVAYRRMMAAAAAHATDTARRRVVFSWTHWVLQRRRERRSRGKRADAADELYERNLAARALGAWRARLRRAAYVRSLKNTADLMDWKLTAVRAPAMMLHAV